MYAVICIWPYIYMYVCIHKSFCTFSQEACGSICFLCRGCSRSGRTRSSPGANSGISSGTRAASELLQKKALGRFEYEHLILHQAHRAARKDISVQTEATLVSRFSFVYTCVKSNGCHFHDCIVQLVYSQAVEVGCLARHLNLRYHLNLRQKLWKGSGLWVVQPAHSTGQDDSLQGP